MVSRQAHNLEIAGSSPASATKGAGGTLGIFIDKAGKVYKSIESLFNDYDKEKQQWIKSRTGIS